MTLIKSKFASTCSCGCGARIPKGINIEYDRTNRKAYLQGHAPVENESTSDMVQANEDAYFDNFCQQNGI